MIGLPWPDQAKTELVFWCQREVCHNLMCHPVRRARKKSVNLAGQDPFRARQKVKQEEEKFLPNHVHAFFGPSVYLLLFAKIAFFSPDPLEDSRSTRPSWRPRRCSALHSCTDMQENTRARLRDSRPGPWFTQPSPRIFLNFCRTNFK